jgi:L-lactate utilization protein LutB
VFSKIFESLEENRREILKESNYALDLIKNLKNGKIDGFENTNELIEEIEKTVEIILNIVSK